MIRRPPRRVERRSSATRADYYRAGRLHLKGALALHPGASPMEALVRSVEDRPDTVDPILRPATARRYLEDLRVLVAVLARGARRAKAPCDPRPAMARIEAALLRRRGRPEVPRGASLRVKDPTEDEARRAFVRLKAIALNRRSPTAAAAAVYVLVGSRIGVRPVELCGAVVEGTVLHIPNAKRADGQAAIRTIELGHLPAVVVEAVRLLTLLAPEPGDPAGFERWRNAIASCLARASLAAGGRRLSLYSFRHIAIANWEKAGFSAEEIAAMAGHLSVRTASRFYARGSSGWAIEELPTPLAVAVVEPAPEPVAEASHEFEPFPEPSAEPAARDARASAKTEEWFDEHRKRIEDLRRRLKPQPGSDEPRQPEDEPDSAPGGKR